jgi:hypothetical protein
MSSSSESTPKSPLDAAQKIVAELSGLSPEHQSLALKFAMETIGLQLPASLSAVGGSRVHPSQPTLPHASNNMDHSTDIRSFTELKAPKSDQQFTAVVAYFYQFEAKPENVKDTIDADVMKEAARLAGRAQVSRWNMTLMNAKNAGYLDAAGNGKFKLSSVGENLVAITLPGNGAPGKKPKNVKKKG